MPPHTSEWKHEVSRIVESHRARRTEPIPIAARQHAARHGHTTAQDRAARIAASVAARYASVPTYTELLEQRRAAAAEEAAHALAETERQLAMSASAVSQRWQETDALAEPESVFLSDKPQMAAYSAAVDDLPFEAESVFLFEPEPQMQPAITGTILLPELPVRSAEMNMHAPETVLEPALEDLLASSVITPPVPLPANLIEFPRELIATRRVRPQLAEGPLRITTANETAQAQLRIFEVESDAAIETEAIPPTVVPESSPEPAPEQFRASSWSSICLDAQPDVAEQLYADRYEQFSVPLQSASIDRRLMAFAVDFCLVTGAFLAFLFVFALSTPHLPGGKTAAVMGSVVYLALWVLYQFLFFTLGDATAGMYYARIALCTFEDENPSRKAMRKRLAAWWISALPLGLGFAWALLDEDNLSWHDRMCRIYQRSY